MDQLGKSSLSKASRPKDVEARLQKVERSLERLITGGMTGEEYETDETENGLPNLKYARPKYQNLESLLKYVEKDGDTVGVRLVIMNFND